MSLELSDEDLDEMARKAIRSAGLYQSSQCYRGLRHVTLCVCPPMELCSVSDGDSPILDLMRTIQFEVNLAGQIVIPSLHLVKETIRELFRNPDGLTIRAIRETNFGMSPSIPQFFNWPDRINEPAERPASEVWADFLKRSATIIDYKKELGE